MPRHLRTSREQLRYVQIDWIELFRPFTIPLHRQVADLADAVKRCGGAFAPNYVGVSEPTLDLIAEALSDVPVSLQRVMAKTELSKPTVTVGLRILGERRICNRTPGTKTRWEYSKDE